MRPTMLALAEEFKHMRSSNALPATVMKYEHWEQVEQILRVRIEGGPVHGEARKVGLLQPHHLVADLLNPYSKLRAKILPEVAGSTQVRAHLSSAIISYLCVP